MEKSRFAIIVVLIIICCILLTYRMLLHQSSEHDLYVIDHLKHNNLIFNHTDMNSIQSLFRSGEQYLRADRISVGGHVNVDEDIKLSVSDTDKAAAINVNRDMEKVEKTYEGTGSSGNNLVNSPVEQQPIPDDDIIAAYVEQEEAEKIKNIRPDPVKVDKNPEPVKKSTEDDDDTIVASLKSQEKAEPATADKKAESVEVEEKKPKPETVKKPKPETVKKPKPETVKKPKEDEDDDVITSVNPQGKVEPTVDKKLELEPVTVAQKLEPVKVEKKPVKVVEKTPESLKAEKEPEPESMQVEVEQKPEPLEGYNDDDAIAASVKPQGKAQSVVVEQNLEPVKVEQKSESLEVGEKLEPVKVEQKSESLEAGEKLEPVKVEQKSESLEVGQKLEPVKVEQKSESLEVEQKLEPVKVEQKKSEPVIGDDDDDDAIAASLKPQGRPFAVGACAEGFRADGRGGCEVFSKPTTSTPRQCPPGLHKNPAGNCDFDKAPPNRNSTLPNSVRELKTGRRKYYGKDARSHPHLSDRERERRQNLLYGDHHNWKSPQNGSHIIEIDGAFDHEELAAHHPDEVHEHTDFTHTYSYVHCVNQSRCIEPELHLEPKLKVYYCKHPVPYGVRFYYLVREGLVLHPNVELVSDIDASDYIVYLPGSAPWHKTECNQTRFASRLIVLDEFDFSYHFFPARNNSELREKYEPMAQRKEHGHIHHIVGNEQWWYYIYFKRSYVKRYNGTFVNYPHITQSHIYPITYSVAEAYVSQLFHFERSIEILCTLRGSRKMPTRQRVQDAVAAYVSERNITNAVTAQVSTASRTTVSTSYFDQMRDAEIIVTVNPAYWEGDFRLWESMATGALIFCDYLDVPHPYPLVHKEHIIFFDNQNMGELASLLDYYRTHKAEARRIAYNGYLFAMKHHRTVNMIDYVLRTTVVKSKWERDHSSWNRLKEVMPRSQVDPTVFMEGSKKAIPPEIDYYGYKYTGQYLHYRASKQLSGMKLGHGRFNGSYA